MRTIKFRAWDKVRKVMLVNHTFRSIAETGLYNNPKLIWEQFTGLLDMNGKEIYEGDIVRDYIGNCIYVFKFGTISYTVKSKLTDQLNDVTFTGFYVDIPKIGTELLLCSSVKEIEIEVLGNVHDNPEPL